MWKVKMGFKTAWRRYYVFSKPGIIYANVITALAGYLFASQLAINWTVLVGLLLGLTAVIASACAYNNYLDRGIDAVMKRTHQRGLVTGDIQDWQALTYASVMVSIGFIILGLTQNSVTVGLVVIAFVDYVILYGIGKRKTTHGTLIGCIAGAIPLVAGYTAVIGKLDLTAALLFGLMVVWQMAHFYGIALYRLQDYKAAGIPVMPAVHGTSSTRIQAVSYIVLFIGMSAMLVILRDLSVLTGVALIILGVVWLIKALRSYRLLPAEAWGKQVFLFSLLVMLGMSGLLAVNPLLL